MAFESIDSRQFILYLLLVISLCACGGGNKQSADSGLDLAQKLDALRGDVVITNGVGPDGEICWEGATQFFRFFYFDKGKNGVFDVPPDTLLVTPLDASADSQVYSVPNVTTFNDFLGDPINMLELVPVKGVTVGQVFGTCNTAPTEQNPYTHKPAA